MDTPLHVLDYCIILVFLFGSLGFGLYFAKTQKTTQNYLNANVGSDTAFLADDKIAAAASNAPTPFGYAKVFTNLKAASNGYVCKFDFFNHSPFILNPCNLRYFKWVLPPLTVS